jgi:hypothetical protein
VLRFYIGTVAFAIADRDSASIFGGLPLPWTSEAASKLNNLGRGTYAAKQPGAVAAKKLTPEEMRRLKANLFKPISTNTTAGSKPAVDKTPSAKKRFGLF